ncbi:MAG: FG-GAP-like repeat-containing protein, partial [Bacteroidota bacterium]
MNSPRLLLICLGWLVACQPVGERTGQQLAQTYCASCHLYTPPELLPQSIWQHQILPYMGARMGMSTQPDTLYREFGMMEALQIRSAGVYAKEPYMSQAEWDSLQAFFLQTAPKELTIGKRPNFVENQVFRPIFPELPLTNKARTSMVNIDAQKQQLAFATADRKYILLDQQLQRKDFAELPGIFVHQERQEDEILLLGVAPDMSAMYPNQNPTGALIKVKEERLQQFALVQSQLTRPVSFASADINQDGQDDLVVCQYGNLIGRLSWYEKTADGYDEHIIKSVPGALKVIVEDVDADQDPDLIVQFAQGNEGISIFLNQGQSFREKRLLSLPPIMGSSDFEWIDFDQDGDKDILLTNGDNGDRSLLLKPYHGLRIYLNDGDYRFAERFFFPMHGASKVKAADYDLDGDLDLMLCSFYPDFENGQEQSILYLQQEAEFEFSASQFPAAKN